jgi:hypothetical protein
MQVKVTVIEVAVSMTLVDGMHASGSNSDTDTTPGL